MDQLIRFFLYFLLGGSMMMATSYINETGRGGLAAMIASLPIFFLTTAMVAYLTAGPETAFTYSRGMVIANVPWLAAVIVFGTTIYHEYHPGLALLGAISAYVLLSLAVADMVV